MKNCSIVIALIALSLSTPGCESSQRNTNSATAPTYPINDFVYRNAAVAADHPVASRAGLEMLRLGGNAVDAAVATSFCLSVVRPYSCGIGGGGFMVIHFPNEDRQITINYREQCPRTVGPEHYVKLRDQGDADAARWGVHASGVPGTVAGLLYALENYGTLDRETVLAPAIRAAEEGFAADASFVSALQSAQERLDQLDGADTSRYHDLADNLQPFIGDRESISIGDTLRNPDQAKALRLIAAHGTDAFYAGPIADAILHVMQEYGGPMMHDDLVQFTVVEREPIRMEFRDLDIVSMPPPSSGGIALAQLFGMLDSGWHGQQSEAESSVEAHKADRTSVDMDNSNPSSFTHNSAKYVHLLAEMMKHAFADRAEFLADDVFAPVPIEQLTNRGYLDALSHLIEYDRTFQPDHYIHEEISVIEDGGTSHISVIDEDGMAVACTETINSGFGSLVVVPGFGFMLNNQMDDFTTIPGETNLYGLQQSDRNLPEPGKRPLSSMSPTIVLRDGQVVAIAGASGGPRIISGTFQCLLNVLEFGMTAGESIAMPRFHHQWLPNTLQLESRWFHGGTGFQPLKSPQQLISRLESIGHEVNSRDDVGVVQLIHITPEGLLHAASDPRKGGRPAGY